MENQNVGQGSKAAVRKREELTVRLACWRLHGVYTGLTLSGGSTQLLISWCQ